MFFPHNSFSSSFCVECVIHALWFKWIGCRPLIWAPFKLQIKDSLFKRSCLKTGIYPREITFYSLTHFIRKLGHRLPSYRTTFIWQKCCFVITASFYQQTSLKLPNNPSRATAFQRALPCIKGLPCLVFKFSCIIWLFHSLEY